MDTNKYIKTLIESIPEYKLTIEDKKCIQFEGIEQFIYRKLTSSKYKNTALPRELEISVKTTINYCVKSNLPIQIMLPFGAFKRWSLPTHPFPDFAEVFNVTLLREYLAPIAAGYEHGVIMHYFSVELFVERIDHIPEAQQTKYENEFRNLINLFSQKLPKNMQFKFSNLKEEISQEEAIKSIDEKVIELRKSWKNMSQKDKDLKIKRATINCKVEKTNPNYNEIILESVFAHDAFSSQCWDKGGKVVWITAPDMITIGNSYTGTWGIHVKSSETSRVNFWVGIGALMKKGDSYIPTILSYEQYESLKENLQFEEIHYFGTKFTNLTNLPIVSD
jgi:hypothetical protein